MSTEPSCPFQHPVSTVDSPGVHTVPEPEGGPGPLRQIDRDDSGAVILAGTDYQRNPYPLYQALAEQGPLHRVVFPSGVHAWLVTGYEAARAALSDERLQKNHEHGNDAWRAKASIMPEPQHSRLQAHLLHQDAPQHTEMRRLIAPAFSRSRALAHKDSIQAMAQDLIDGLPKRSLPGEPPVDLIADFAAILPFRVLAEAIGLPADLADRFRREWGRVVAPVGPEDPWRSEYERLLQELEGYIAEVIKRSRGDDADPGAEEPAGEKGLLRDLASAQSQGKITEDELSSIIFQLLIAGQEPVTHQIGTALLALLTQAEALEQFLGASPELREDLVDELMRYDGAFELATWRFFTRDTEFHGQVVPAGDSVIIGLAAANRDSRHFPAAETVDFSRREAHGQLTFGHGVHRCPGTYLAKAQISIALSALFDRLPGLKLAVEGPGALPWSGAVLSRGVTWLPVHYDQRLPRPADRQHRDEAGMKSR